MKYRVDLTITAHLDVDADSEEEARSKVEDGYSMTSIVFEDDEVDDIHKLDN